MIVALAASRIPARRAALTNPMSRCARRDRKGDPPSRGRLGSLPGAGCAPRTEPPRDASGGSVIYDVVIRNGRLMDGPSSLASMTMRPVRGWGVMAGLPGSLGDAMHRAATDGELQAIRRSIERGASVISPATAPGAEGRRRPCWSAG
jgi:hypothetical protein